MLSTKNISLSVTPPTATTPLACTLRGDLSQTLSLRNQDGGLFYLMTDLKKPNTLLFQLRGKQIENIKNFSNDIRDKVTSECGMFFDGSKYMSLARENQSFGDYIKLNVSAKTKWFIEKPNNEFITLSERPELKNGYIFSVTASISYKPWIFNASGKEMWGFTLYADEIAVYPISSEKKNSKVSIIDALRSTPQTTPFNDKVVDDDLFNFNLYENGDILNQGEPEPEPEPEQTKLKKSRGKK